MSKEEKQYYGYKEDRLKTAWKDSIDVFMMPSVLDYLEKHRKLTHSMIRRGGLRYSSTMKRILYRHGEFIQGRTILNDVKPKYLNTFGKLGKPIVTFDSSTKLFTPYVLTEGLYDALTLSERLISLTGFGSKLSETQVMTLRNLLLHLPSSQHLIIWFDYDAVEETLALKQKLYELGDRVKVMFTPNSEDPNNLGLDGAMNTLLQWFPRDEFPGYWRI